MSIRYNTAVFSTISANNYYIILVVQDFLGSLSNYNVYNNGSAELADSSVLDTLHEAAVNDRLVNYTSTDYMTAYGVNFICGGDWNFDTNGNSLLCTLSVSKAAASDWTIGGYRISYYIVEEVEEKC
ncbi:uncharacterized protein K444DRAFT_625353 [Hyaloscypha bicolor E]|uniref:Uncharacterized protein n=1 Tax=Hyaloscypha bicolor E TaxID=1095630 RepID=A0A2J6TNV2_9HELO|nr:uncharacterized protein K444DRAFT_625353 [Hyaloscypha bicolor E]PMD64694.1 hypothetical protein K444DRAFT_625353 [Hyaloscypha bicolor E]